MTTEPSSTGWFASSQTESVCPEVPRAYNGSDRCWGIDILTLPLNQSPSIYQPTLAMQPFYASTESRDPAPHDYVASQSPRSHSPMNNHLPTYNSAQNQYAAPIFGASGFLDADLTDVSNQVSKTFEFHVEVLEAAPNTCHQCHERLPNRHRLDSHAKSTKHKAYACLCGDLFSRHDTLSRHINKCDQATLHPCPYCTKTKPFTRADHLTQHCRGYHNIEIEGSDDSSPEIPSHATISRGGRKLLKCSYEGCSYHSDFGGVFNSQKEFNQHLREFHDDCLFPCNVPGCPRVGGRGFFREEDRIKHRKTHNKDQAMAGARGVLNIEDGDHIMRDNFVDQASS